MFQEIVFWSIVTRFENLKKKATVWSLKKYSTCYKNRSKGNKNEVEIRNKIMRPYDTGNKDEVEIRKEFMRPCDTKRIKMKLR